MGVIILGWIIAGAVLIVLLLLLLFNVTVIFDFNGDIYLRISYLCFTIVKIPAKKKKNRRKKRRAKKALKSVAKLAEDAAVDEVKSENSENGSTAKSSENKAAKSKDKTEEKKSGKNFTLEEIFEMVKMILDSLGKPLKKLLKRTRISHLRLEIICGGDDAAKAALNFGRMNIIVGNALGWIDSFFTLKSVDDLHIDVDFGNERTAANAYCEARLTLIAALAFVFTLLGRAIRFYSSHGKAKSAVDKFIKK